MDRESELHAEKMNLSVELDSCRAICGQLTHDMARLRDEVDGLIAAAVRAERERWVRAVMDVDELADDWVTKKLSDPHFARLHLREMRKLEAEEAVYAERERLIPLVCRRCSLGRSPSRPKSQVEPYAGWVHMTAVEVFNCPASPIHEALRESAEEQEND